MHITNILCPWPNHRAAETPRRHQNAHTQVTRPFISTSLLLQLLIRPPLASNGVVHIYDFIEMTEGKLHVMSVEFDLDTSRRERHAGTNCSPS